ncbi:TPA: hypothetical protein ACS70C_002471 [Providencia alcalifaciens]
MNNVIAEGEKKLIEAMYQTIREFFHFTDEESRVLNVEYLLTVNVAKKLIEINEGYPGPYRVYLEHPTKILQADCLPIAINGSMFSKSEIRIYDKYISRPGRVDVCVYKQDNVYKYPLFLVEVKGFNPRLGEVEKDIIRISQFMNATCNTGASLLKSSFFISLYRYEKVYNDTVENKLLDKSKEKIKSIIEKIGIENIKYKISAFPISKGRASEETINDYHEMGISERLTDNFTSHLFIGVIVYFYK